MTGLLFSNIAASAAILIILLLRKLFKNRFFSKIFVLLWLFVIIRLLLPFEFSSGISLYPSASEPEKVFYETEEVFIEDFPAEEFIPEKREEIPAPALEVPEKSVDPSRIILFIWISGGVFTGGFFAAKHYYTVKRIIASCVPYDDVPEEFRAGKTRFYKSRALCSPLSFGLFNPVVVIPENTEESRLFFVLLHETIHIRDRDAALKILALLALSINWFNPFVWVMVRFFDRDIEIYCDERVLSAAGGEKASSYAGAILDFAERESLLFSSFSAASLCERVTSIMNNKKKKGHYALSAAVFLLVILMMTACGTLPEEKKPENSSDELIEILRSAEWESDSFITFDMGAPGEALAYKGEENEISFSWNFTDLPVEKIIIRDLGIPENSDSPIVCLKTHREILSVNDYDALLECGFDISYQDGRIIISSEEPIGEIVPDFCLTINVNLEETDIISEGAEVFYFGMPNLNEEYSREKHAKAIRYLDDPIEEENTFRTKRVFEDPGNKISRVVIENFGFSNPGYADINFINSDYFMIEAVWGNELSEAGFGIETSEGTVLISTEEEVDSVSEDFTLTIYGDFFAVELEYEKVNVTKHLYSKESSSADIGTNLIWPTEGGYICCQFWGYNGHTGIDIMPENGAGSDIYAAADGTVVKAKRSKIGYGYHIIIDHGNGTQTLYAHCDDIFVKTGDTVKSGDVIASVGSTGNSTGTHLHFELRHKGEFIDPEKYLPEAKEV